jgi:hypothetical protein
MAPTSAERVEALVEYGSLFYKKWCIKRWFGKDRGFMEFDISVFFEICLENSNFVKI